jgi:hypothetical protein
VEKLNACDESRAPGTHPLDSVPAMNWRPGVGAPLGRLRLDVQATASAHGKSDKNTGKSGIARRLASGTRLYPQCASLHYDYNYKDLYPDGR